MAKHTIQRYHIHDFSLKSAAQHDNPFSVQLSATFENESGEKIENLPGFYDGDGWKIRFSPTCEGVWHGRTSSDHPALNNIVLDDIECVPNENANLHGVLQIDPQHRQKFSFSDATPFVPLGFECDWLFSYHQADAERCHRHINLIAEHGFNYIVTNLYAHTGFSTRQNSDERPIDPAYIFSPPAMYPFGGSNDDPNHSRLNVDFFADFDRLMRYLHNRGIVVHLMIQVQNKSVRWPARRSPEDDLFWRYVVARYQAFCTLVWDIGKESKNLMRETGSHAYTIERIEAVKQADAYNHLVTVHDTEQSSAGTFSDADAAADFFSDQVHLKDVRRYNREAIRCLRSLPKPYLNIEYGYEVGAENWKTYHSGSGTTTVWQDVLKWTWAIYLAGAYPCYYYNNTSWDLIKFEPEPPGWKRYKFLKDFLDTLSFNEMQADNELVERGLCLAQVGRQYLIYLPEGGDAVVDLSAVAQNTLLTAEWMDIYSGDRRKTKVEKARKLNGFATCVENPLQDKQQPCVLIIRASH